MSRGGRTAAAWRSVHVHRARAGGRLASLVTRALARQRGAGGAIDSTSDVIVTGAAGGSPGTSGAGFDDSAEVESAGAVSASSSSASCRARRSSVSWSAAGRASCGVCKVIVVSCSGAPSFLGANNVADVVWLFARITTHANTLGAWSSRSSGVGGASESIDWIMNPEASSSAINSVLHRRAVSVARASWVQTTTVS